MLLFLFFIFVCVCAQFQLNGEAWQQQIQTNKAMPMLRNTIKINFIWMQKQMRLYTLIFIYLFILQAHTEQLERETETIAKTTTTTHDAMVQKVKQVVVYENRMK